MYMRLNETKCVTENKSQYFIAFLNKTDLLLLLGKKDVVIKIKI